ncbi:hypothetical protein FGW37_32880 [Streptomyces rectiverticillatus]|nr:hypothetical protein FGW37_32880 [Streptomyces rectiverticillatus]
MDSTGRQPTRAGDRRDGRYLRPPARTRGPGRSGPGRSRPCARCRRRGRARARPARRACRAGYGRSHPVGRPARRCCRPRAPS